MRNSFLHEQSVNSGRKKNARFTDRRNRAILIHHSENFRQRREGPMGRVRETLHDVLRQTDAVLLALCVASTLYGMVLIASATSFRGTLKYVAVQGLGLLIGLVLYFFLSRIDVFALAKQWKWLLGFGIVLFLLLKTPLGIENNGNRAWLGIRGFPANIQPAEIVKLTFIIVLAKQLSWLKENRDLRSISSIVMLAAHFGVIFALYYKISSDMGSALVFLFIFACMCFVAGVALRWFLIGGGAAGLLFYAMWDLDLLDTYMKNRFIVLFDHSYDPLNTGWQQTRSLLTLGGGRIFGQGLFRGTQTQSEAASSLPHRHTDFIFSVIGEELGLVGCLLTLALLTAIILRCLYVARHAKTRLEGYACIGVASVIIFQVIINVGMCLFVMPVIGLTLPFISYGGSSLVMLFACMGLVSGVHGRAKPDWLR